MDLRLKFSKVRILKRLPDRRIRISALAVLLACLSPLAHGQSLIAGVTNPPVVETFSLPKSGPDPLEPLNRVMWYFNQGLMTGVIKPTGNVYRFVVVKPVRTGIANFGRNLIYPGRLINNLLQGKWRGARDESYHNQSLKFDTGEIALLHRKYRTSALGETIQILSAILGIFLRKWIYNLN